MSLFARFLALLVTGFFASAVIAADSTSTGELIPRNLKARQLQPQTTTECVYKASDQAQIWGTDSRYTQRQAYTEQCPSGWVAVSTGDLIAINEWIYIHRQEKDAMRSLGVAALVKCCKIENQWTDTPPIK